MLEHTNEDLDFKVFQEIIPPCYTFFRKILQNNLTITDLDEFTEKTKEIYTTVKETDTDGFLFTKLPHFAKLDPEVFAVSVCTVDGQRVDFGDAEHYASLQHISSVVSYLIALEQNGTDVVASYIGTEPSGKQYDSLELKDGIPHNPLITSGSLMS